jgi:hypothetical protein
MLPDDIKQRRQSVEQTTRSRVRASLTRHSVEPIFSRVAKLYSARDFNNATASWIVQTDQVKLFMYLELPRLSELWMILLIY